MFNIYFSKADKVLMKIPNIIFIFLAFLFSTNIYGSCLCRATKNGMFYFEQRVKSKAKCESEILTHNLQSYKQGRICTNERSSISIKWACVKNKNDMNLKPKIFSCSEIVGMGNVETMLSAVNFATVFTQPKALSPTAMIEADAKEKCTEKDEKVSQKKSEKSDDNKNISKSDIKGVGVHINNDIELLATLEKVLPKKYQPIPGEILDQIKSGTFSFHLLNDNNIVDIQGGGVGDDIGKTHGLKINFEMALDRPGYKMAIEYASDLYTNFTDPINTQNSRWWDDQGNVHASQNFIEENIGKILIEKEKKGDAYYYSYGGGVHQLNKTNGKGTLGILSALGSQTKFHEFVVNNGGKARLYNNIGQPNDDEVSLFVEGKLGKRTTLLQTDNTRTFLEYEAKARLSGVEDSSYIGVKGAAYVDYQVTQDFATRVGLGHESKVYASGDTTNVKFVEVVMGSKKYEAGFKYEFSNSETPSYQNALPDSFVDKHLYIPKSEGIWNAYVKYKF